MDNKPEAVINLRLFNPYVITTKEYEQISKELMARALSGDITLIERIVYTLIDNMSYRYYEAKKQNEGKL
jgi:hypothetical protein